MPVGSSLVPVASFRLPTPAFAAPAEAAACIQAATYELLVLIRQFDERGGWEGFASCAHWLSWRIGLAPGAAREHVRVARALADLPRLSAAMQRGAVSYSKVRAVTRVATPETEQAEDRRRHESRALHTRVDDDGMVVVRGRLTPEVGAVLRRALDAVLDAAPRPVDPDGRAEDAAGGPAPTIAQRRADALGAVAECALAGGLDKGTAGDRYQVVVHVDADTLADDGEGHEVAETAPHPSDGNGDAGPATGEGHDTPAPYVPAGTYDQPDAAADGAVPAATAGPAPPRSGTPQRPTARRADCPAAARGQSALDEAASTSPRRRPGGWPATPRRSRCGTVTRARC